MMESFLLMLTILGYTYLGIIVLVFIVVGFIFIVRVLDQ